MSRQAAKFERSWLHAKLEQRRRVTWIHNPTESEIDMADRWSGQAGPHDLTARIGREQRAALADKKKLEAAEKAWMEQFREQAMPENDPDEIIDYTGGGSHG
jgi:hypothetical protein